MNIWPLTGLLKRVPATHYPALAEKASGTTPGRPAENNVPAAAALCPTGAIAGGGRVDLQRCIHCFRCVREEPGGAAWVDDYEWAEFAATGRGPLPDAFRRSIHVRIVDAGDCGACLAELTQLLSPDYSLLRLGIHITPSPREADVLLVVGPVTNAMRGPLAAAWAAMPEPRRVVAVGACAASGGVFGPSFECYSGIAESVPVDLVIPGCPPPPLALLHGLLAVMGRTQVEVKS